MHFALMKLNVHLFYIVSFRALKPINFISAEILGHLDHKETHWHPPVVMLVSELVWLHCEEVSSFITIPRNA